MTFELAKRLIDETNKTKLKVLQDELFKYAIEYSRIRVDWYMMEDAERKEIEDLRTAKHNALIDCCNILSREMIKVGEDASWREMLGNDRKEMGDFACYINLILGIKGR
ncbi:MAG: hypothetical protein JXA68_00540 [Ignavibacteriales bacterium]|nr:hypothetical protein [Ignavibacteriales bacterium]